MQRHEVRGWRIGWTCRRARKTVAGVLKPAVFDRFDGRKFPADLVDLKIRCGGCLGRDLDAAIGAGSILQRRILVLVGGLRAAALAAAAERHWGPVGTRTGRHHRGSFQRAAAEGNPAGDQERADSMCEAGPVHDCSYVERIDILLNTTLSPEHAGANDRGGYSDETD